MDPQLMILGIGTLMLLANLVLCTVLAPDFSQGNSPGSRLRRMVRILMLAFTQIAAWAVLLDQSGAADSPEHAAENALRIFTFIGRNTDALTGPWTTLVPFIALNGLLILPACFISGFIPETKELPQTPPAPLPSQSEEPSEEKQKQDPTSIPVASREPFRGKIPPTRLRAKVQGSESEVPTLDADQPLERVPPTPPPIRFQ